MRFSLTLVVLLACALPVVRAATLKIGQPAPDFTAPGSKGSPVSGLDAIASTDANDTARVAPCIKKVLLAGAQDQPVAQAVTGPHGCSFKY
jgi:hypothetical protein